jgi:hypothetical protein
MYSVDELIFLLTAESERGCFAGKNCGSRVSSALHCFASRLSPRLTAVTKLMNPSS